MIRSEALRVVGAMPAPPRAMAGSASAPASFLRALLDEQQDLSAVERFARAHDQDALPEQARFYKDLLPASAPGPGQQYAFEVDLDACSGCKACVVACHHLNGLEEDELWRSVGLLQGGTSAQPVQATVTTACHHCVDPACMTGCPVGAYEKDPVTGIVKHLDDQCFGCQYCTLMCPYDAPKYSKKLGIVRKCDMCSGRLAVGEAPACVQACPSSAIRISLVDTAQMIEESTAGVFLPGTTSPADTVPTTRYVTKKAMPKNLLPADFFTVRAEHAHTPLVLMLVLTQLSVGAYAVTQAASLLGGEWATAGFGARGSFLALCFGLVAMAASIFHLGRPQLAYRALIGLRTSWLSREIAAFSAFAGCAGLHAASFVVPLLGGFRAELGALSAGVGLAAVFCSVMVYAATRREHWRAALTGRRFLGTTAILGTAVVVLVTGLSVGSLPRVLLVLLVIVSISKLVPDLAVLLHLRDRQHGPLRRVAMLMTTELRAHTSFRFILAALGGVVIPAILLATGPPGTHVPLSPVGPVFCFVFCVLGELLERHLFFTAAPAPRMPGVAG